MNTNKNMITIDLSDTDSGAFSDDQFLQRDAKKHFNKIMTEIFESITSDSTTTRKTNHSFDRVHNTILINGKRGMGKTSFIFSVLDSESSKTLRKDICDLGVIDPTLIETKEHIFLNVIQLIQEKIEDEIKHSSKIGGVEHREWLNKLKKLSSGLSFLDGVGSEKLKNALWDSPELIIEQGLLNVKDGKNLEKYFHDFIDESLKVLDRKAFFLVFDDVDTSVNEGESILETLRKYFTSRKLIITLLGDIDIYSVIIRQLQWKRFDPDRIILTYENKEDYKKQVSYLEEQYTNKILKAENRIKLKSLYEIRDDVYIKENPNSDEESLVSIFSEILEKGFKLGGQTNYKKLFEEKLLNQPTRSVIQLLKAWMNAKGNKVDNKPDMSFFTQSIYNIFYTTLNECYKGYEFHEYSDPGSLINLISIYIISFNRKNDSYLKLIPAYVISELDSKGDNVIPPIYLNSTLMSKLEPKHYLSYFIRFGYVIDQHSTGVDGKRYIDHIRLSDYTSNSELARRILTTFKIDSNTHTHNPYLIGNLSLSSGQYDKIRNKTVLIPYISGVHNDKTGAHRFISFFSMIGFLADLLVSDGKDYFSDQQDVSRLYGILNEKGVTSDNFNEHEVLAEIVINNTDNKKYNEELQEWSQESKRIVQYLSAPDLYDIWRNIWNSFKGIDDELKKEKRRNNEKDYSEALELYTVAFLNAVFIQCEKKKGRTVDVKSPLTDPNYFYDKLIGYESDKDCYTFFDFLWECPFLNFGCWDLNDVSISNEQNGKVGNKVAGMKSYVSNSIVEGLKEISSKDDNESNEEVEGSLHPSYASKPSFKDLDSNEQIKEIKKVARWKVNKSQTTAQRLRYKYSSVSNELVSKLIKQMKEE